MSAFEGSQKSQLQGVSQQIARERLDGQVSSQDNMLSDVVTGLRRRPGSVFTHASANTGAADDTILGWTTDIGGQQVNVVVNCTNGNTRVYSVGTWTLLHEFTSVAYLVASNSKFIRGTTVGDRFMLANTTVQPTLSGTQGGIRPGRGGFFMVRTGAFETEYKITLKWTGGADQIFTYTTPAATVTGAAAQSTPTYIANQLATQAATAGWTAANDGAFGVILKTTDTDVQLTLTTTLASTYLSTSNLCYVQSASDLPARLPSIGDGFVCQVGSVRVPTYYKFNLAKGAWLEAGAYSAPGSITNMPVQLYYDGANWQIDSTAYEGCLAGDATSNPTPTFVSRGITGISSFQGRFVILTGNHVVLSGSGNSKRFFRTTLEALIASDPIDVGSSANSSAAYEYGVPFQKDLLLFSEKYQALIPGGNQPVTPATASVVITSTYESDLTSSPITLGRTLVFSSPRSKDFYGIREMLPSQYTDSQYISEDVTAHIPKYLAGRCRFAVSSSVANLVLFASTQDKNVVYVHEYLWDGDKKAQQAWHRWVLPYPIADAFFTGSEINLLFAVNDTLVVGVIDPRIGTLTVEGDRRPYLDLYTTATVAAHSVSIPAYFTSLDDEAYLKVKLADTAIELQGEEVGIDSRFADHLITVPSFDAGPVTIGVPYRSSMSPTTPVIKDKNGVVISSNKLTLLRYMVGTANSSEYEAIIHDASVDTEDDVLDVATLYWGSAELDLGHARVNSESTAILPCRTNAASTTMVLFTEGLGEMNIISIEYVCRYNQKLRRR